MAKIATIRHEMPPVTQDEKISLESRDLTNEPGIKGKYAVKK